MTTHRNNPEAALFPVLTKHLGKRGWTKSWPELHVNLNVDMTYYHPANDQYLAVHGLVSDYETHYQQAIGTQGVFDLTSVVMPYQKSETPARKAFIKLLVTSGVGHFMIGKHVSGQWGSVNPMPEHEQIKRAIDARHHAQPEAGTPSPANGELTGWYRKIEREAVAGFLLRHTRRTVGPCPLPNVNERTALRKAVERGECNVIITDEAPPMVVAIES